MNNETDRDEKRKREVIIQDLRHGRDLETEDEPEEATSPADLPAEPAPAVEPTVSPQEAEPRPVEPPELPAQRVVESEENTNTSSVKTPGQPATTPGEEDPTAEIDQLRQLFGAGIDSYLRGQLGLLLNFALIYLGRSPNPATGLMSPNTDKAKLAIDIIEFIAARIQQNMPEAERAEIASVLSELKYAFMQSVADAPPPREPSDPRK
jgi:hypothetical protein